jgi:FMN reductase
MLTEGDGPLVVGLGGTLRSNSSTERALRQCLAAVERQGGRTKLYCGDDIDLPMYNPHEPARTREAVQLIEALHEADAVIVGSPGYHGGISGLVKNALDYIEDVRADSRVYLDNKPWGYQFWDEAGELIDATVANQLDLLASQLLTFARSGPGQVAR